MEKYEIGQVVNSFKNHQEGVYFDISDIGATMLVFFRNPTQKEISQFESNKSFEIRFVELHSIIIITVKIGILNWMDAPYTPHLSKNLTGLQIPNKGEGLSLTLILVDAITGEIKHMRILGLSELFTKNLFCATIDHKAQSFNVEKYNNSLAKIFSTYTTNEIVKLSKCYCKIN